MKNSNIAIDGTCGAGKSTVAKEIANKLGYLYIDTGAMYRAVAYKNILENNPNFDKDKVIKILNEMELNVDIKDNKQTVLINNEDITDKLRTREISAGASTVATIREVREKLVEIQRKIASNKSVVMDGRDIGTYVLPNAKYKFYVDASVEERARRRHEEYVKKGDLNVPFESVVEEIRNRDFNDKNRRINPLRKADDAVVIDSTSLGIDELISEILDYISVK